MKSRMDKEVDLLGQNRLWKFSTSLLIAAINFFILAGIFIGTLIMKLRAQYLSGDEEQVDYVKNAFLRGLMLSLIATVSFFVVDFISGGFASLLIMAIYPLAGISMLVFSLMKPSYLFDITEGDMSRISAYKLWSISFWPLFIVGMIVALSLGALTTYIGSKISRIILDTLVSISSSP
jgi:hypothetical protein